MERAILEQQDKNKKKQTSEMILVHLSRWLYNSL